MVLASTSLAGRIIVVTGASSGLGAATAVAAAAAGADVVLGARRLDQLERTGDAIRALGRDVLAVRTDVPLVADCQDLIAAAVTRFGVVDGLLNSAGVGTATPATRESPEQISS